eukprot:gene39425-51965_t
MAPFLSVDLLQRINSISQLGSFSDTLKTSVLLKIFEGISIGSALPSLVDIILDKVSNKSSVDIADHYNFFPVFMMMVVTGTMYLSLYDQDFIGYLYACNFGIKILTFTSVITHSLSTGVIATQRKIPSFLFILPVIGFAAMNICMSYSLIFPNSAACSALLSVFSFIALISLVGLSVWWFYSLWCYYQTTHYLTFEEKKETLYLVGCLLYMVLFSAFSAKTSSDWFSVDEKSLIIFCILFISGLLSLTVVPNRLLKSINEIKELALRLKRAFVRYVSHEIRSPLNVTTAGLELLRFELLDLAIIPLLNVFAGRLEAYKFMASKKSITLRIEDRVQVSDYSASDEVDLESEISPRNEGGNIVMRFLRIPATSTSTDYYQHYRD